MPDRAAATHLSDVPRNFGPAARVLNGEGGTIPAPHASPSSRAVAVQLPDADATATFLNGGYFHRRAETSRRQRHGHVRLTTARYTRPVGLAA